MSRSYKKPIAKDQYTPAKRWANKAVRTADDIADGKAYRKEFCSWSISDWSFDVQMPKGKGKKARKARAMAVRK